jgi:hypothetical protein
MAPASGAYTRMRLRRQGEEVADYLIDAGRELVDKCEDLYERSGEVVEDTTHELSAIIVLAETSLVFGHYLRGVEFGAGNLDKVTQVLVKRVTASDEHLFIQQCGHGFTEARLVHTPGGCPSKGRRVEECR